MSRGTRSPPDQEAVVGAAWAVYARGGLEALSLERVADWLGVGLPAVQRHFATDLALAQEMILRGNLGPSAAVEAAVDRARTGEEALDGVLRGIAGYYLAHPEQCRLAYGEAWTRPDAVGFTQELVRTRMLTRGRGMFDRAEQLLASEWGTTELPHGMHPRRLVFLTYLTALGFIMARDMMARIGSGLSHSDEQMLDEISRSVASGPNVLRQLSALNAAARELVGLRTEVALVERVPQLLQEALEFERVALLLRDPEGAFRLVSVSPADTSTERLWRGAERLPQLRDPQTVVWAADSVAATKGDGQSLVAVALLAQGRYAGSLLGAFSGGTLDARDLSRLEMFASTVGLALESVRLHENLQGLVDQRTHQLRQTQELVAGIAHELNTPLGAMHSAQDSLLRGLDKVELLLTRTEPDTAAGSPAKRTLRVLRDLGGVIGTASDRAAKTVARLRDFVRLDQADIEAVDVHDCIDGALRFSAHRLGQGIEVVRSFSELPPLLCAPTQLNQLFLNLLDNAILALEGRGTLTIATRAEEHGLEIRVEDDGVGIAEQHLSRVFDAGFTTRANGVGTGLGLSICHQIVKAHGGSISLTSTLGQGTRVDIHLPLRADPPGASAPAR